MLFACVAVLAVAVFLFVMETGAVQLAAMHAEAQRAKWSVCTLEPPWFDWRPDCSYSCFLSHYKVEAASDARFLHDVLRKMLRCPVFLDSSSLADLRLLLRDGVEDSDIIVLLGTKGVLTRPWCLLEILHAHRKQVPVLLVGVSGRGFDIDEQLEFANDLESNMMRLNPDGIPVLHKEMHTTDLSMLQTALVATLEKFKASPRKLFWNPHAGDEEIIASLKDMVEGMAQMTDRKVVWRGEQKLPATRRLTKEPASRRLTATTKASDIRMSRLSERKSRPSEVGNPSPEAMEVSSVEEGGTRQGIDRSSATSSSCALRRKTLHSSRPILRSLAMLSGKDRKELAVPVAFIAAQPDDAVMDARVLQTELAMHTGRRVLISTPGSDAHHDSEVSPSVIVLLTKNALTDPALLYTVYRAARLQKTILPICLAGRGYDFGAASAFLEKVLARSRQCGMSSCTCSPALGVV